MPPLVHQLLEKIPLHVEDYPAREILEEKGIEDPAELCGLFTGIALPDDSVSQPWKLPDVVTVYRLGVLAAAEDHRGRVSIRRLRKEIRITDPPRTGPLPRTDRRRNWRNSAMAEPEREPGIGD